MKVEQIYTGCLAEAAYYIESNGEAVVIDPMREPEPYIERAERDGAKIKYVLETHFHADFVSGHLELARRTGATIVYGPTASANFDIKVVEDNEVLKVGDITITALHTPGHTMESTTYLLKDKDGKDYAIFSGDTLFLGDVGRPDLAIKQGEITRDDLAGFLFDSLRNKIMPLADDVIVYPNHGAGSACGKKMSSDTWGYLGDQKKTNYALRPDMTREEFVKEVTDGLVAPPQYFPKNAMLNKMGYNDIESIREQGLQAHSVRAFKAAWEEREALVIDTRCKTNYPKGHIPGSIFIGAGEDAKFASWLGALITDLETPILLVCNPGEEQGVVDRMARVGYENPIGYLDGGFDAWKAAGEEVDTLEELTPEEVKELYGKIDIMDVRKHSEYNAQHIKGAEVFPLDLINSNMGQIDRNKKYYMYCQSGYRSVVAASILKSRGIHGVANIVTGFNELSKVGLPFSDYVEQNTEL